MQSEILSTSRANETLYPLAGQCDYLIVTKRRGQRPTLESRGDFYWLTKIVEANSQHQKYRALVDIVWPFCFLPKRFGRRIETLVSSHGESDFLYDTDRYAQVAEAQ